MRSFDAIRKAIYELEKGTHSQTNFYREITKYLIEKVSTLKITDEEGKTKADIPTFFANPERAVAKLKEQRNLTLPVISVSIDDIEEDVDRRRTDSIVETQKAWDKTAQRAVRVVSLAAKPVKVTFMVNFWAKYIEDINQMVEEFQLFFNPGMPIRTSKSNTTLSYISQVADNSTLQIGDREDRVIKKSIMVALDTYIPNKTFQLTNTGELLDVSLDIVLFDTDKQYQEAVGGDIEGDNPYPDMALAEKRWSDPNPTFPEET